MGWDLAACYCQTSAWPNSSLPTAPQSHSTARIAPVSGNPNCRCVAHVGFWIVSPGSKTQHSLHRLDLCPIPAQLPLPSPLPAAPPLCCLHSVCFAAFGSWPWQQRLGGVCTSYTCPGPQVLPGAALPQTNSWCCSWSLGHPPNLQLEGQQGVPCSGLSARPRHWGHREGSCCSLAAALSAPELAG